MADITKAWDMVRGDFRAFEKEWHKYGKSGICDTEGRWACKDILEDKMRGVPCRVSFSRLDGYSGHKRSVGCPYSKRDIANNMSKALTKLAKSFKKAYNKYGFDEDRFGRHWMSIDAFIDSIW